jgi:phospholipid/cholesterol/gamma-HCH transport system substrate-binding protein
VRRIAVIVLVTALCGASALVASAGADDKHTYQVELDNAFGLVSGSEVRIAGVVAGTVTGLDINEAKRAVVTIEISGPLSTLKESATCSSEPQSLIAEYFLDCQPGTQGDPLPEDGLIPVRSEEYGNQTFTTVQQDLVQSTLRQPFKERLALLFNEFGTALAGNPENLNEAIRRGAPALRDLHKALTILARQNAVIRDLNVNSDRIVKRLTERRQDVVAFIRNANAASVASAERREDLARNFELLPGFLTELRPTLVSLGELAEEQTPLLVDLRVAAPQLNRLTRTLPPFNDASEPAIRSLGSTADIGRRALGNGRDEIAALRNATDQSYSAANQLANLLVDLDDPNRAVENDTRAARDSGRSNPTGYTGLEGLLNYVYYQTGAISQFDSIGHLLHFTLAEFEAGPCGHYNAGPTVPAAGGGETRSASNINRCVAWIGPNQPGINEPIIRAPYHPSVCPDGSTDESLCRPSNAREVAAIEPRSNTAGEDQASGPPGVTGETGNVPLPDPDLPDLPQTPGVPQIDQETLDDILGTNGDAQREEALQQLLESQQGGSANPAATADLLDYLFGN